MPRSCLWQLANMPPLEARVVYLGVCCSNVAHSCLYFQQACKCSVQDRKEGRKMRENSCSTIHFGPANLPSHESCGQTGRPASVRSAKHDLGTPWVAQADYGRPPYTAYHNSVQNNPISIHVYELLPVLL